MFSHPDKYIRAKLTYTESERATKTVVHNVHSVLGSTELKWILGLITLREDGFYYIEDSTYAAKISFASLENVENDAFFTETCVVLA